MNVIVNGVTIGLGKWPNPEVAAVRELLRQRALALGLLEDGNADDDAIEAAIERLLEEEVRVPTPTDAECRRYYEAHPQEFSSGDLVHVRHILFQVTPAAPILRIRTRAEQTLAEILHKPDRFAGLARELSNCPSAQQGGNLGQIARGDTVPEFEQALFQPAPTGILRELVKTRHGFHIVAIDRRIPGEIAPIDRVRDRIAARLEAKAEEQALRQYISILAGKADIVGVELARATTSLVQ